MRKLHILILSALFTFYHIIPVAAGGPVFWRVNSRAEVEKGDARGISIADNGSMMLAPLLSEVFDTKQAYIWSAVADNTGNIFLGTGNEGRVFKVDAAGKGTLFYKASELSVMALAVDAKGNVYAGTSPDGKVYRIAPNGESKVFFDPKAKYIWALAFDQQGRLLVGTGDKGSIYRVNPDGSGEALIKTTQTNITALKVDSAGNIIAGTDPGGLILRISGDGKAFTLLDTQQREVRDLAFGRDGSVYALVLAESAGSGATNTSPPAAATPAIPTGDEGVTITISDLQVLEPSATSSVTAPVTGSTGAGQAKSVLYRIDPAGLGESIWDSRDAAAFAIAVDADDQVLVGTGQKGRIYSVKTSNQSMLLTQLPEAQTSRIVRAGNQFYAAASNLGKLFRLNNETGGSGTYTSSIRDALTTANWGRVSWLGEGAVEVQTRSGNTATPDMTWSDWSAPITNQDGDAIKSPPARYLQWRATLKREGVTAAPRLREVSVSYLPRNLAPRITSLSVLPAGVTLQAAMPQAQIESTADPALIEATTGGAVMQIPPRRVFQRGAVSLQWQGEDRNGDQIEYSVYYRNAAGGTFFELKTGLRDGYFTVDPNALPDGRYVFKVVASDGPSNPAGLALTDEQETEPVEIDNTPPAVSADAPRLNGNNVEILFRAADSTSIIRRAEYQIDGGQWRSVFPVDGIADSKREDFRVSVTLADRKPHVVAFRAFDANSNIGSAQAEVILK